MDIKSFNVRAVVEEEILPASEIDSNKVISFRNELTKTTVRVEDSLKTSADETR